MLKPGDTLPITLVHLVVGLPAWLSAGIENVIFHFVESSRG
jgi:hypothetical protein